MRQPAVSVPGRCIRSGTGNCKAGSTVGHPALQAKGRLTEYEGWTNKFIFPPYEFSVPDAFISNFHLPYSTLLMMVAAFGGYDQVMKAYEVAVKEKYQIGRAHV